MPLKKHATDSNEILFPAGVQDVDGNSRRLRGDSRVSSLSSYSADTCDESVTMGVSAILRPVSVKNAPATADAKFRGNSVDAADGKAERDVPSTSPITAEYVGSSRHLIADQMFSLLQLESDGSDSNSIKMNSKVKSKVKKSKEITILDAIIGLKNAHSKSIGSESKDRNCQNKEKSYLQRKNEALEEYMGPAAQVIPINKDQRKTVFKDNTTLLQTVKGHTGAIWALKFAPDGRYLASGGQDGKLIIWTVGQPSDGAISPQSSRKDSDASGASNSFSLHSSEAEKDLESPEAHEGFNSTFSGSGMNSERRHSGNNSVLGVRPGGSAMAELDYQSGSSHNSSSGKDNAKDGIANFDRSRSASPSPCKVSVSPSKPPAPISALSSSSLSSTPRPISPFPIPTTVTTGRGGSGKDGLNSVDSSFKSSTKTNMNANMNINMRTGDNRSSGKEKEKENKKEKGKEDVACEDNRSSGTFDRFEEVTEEEEVKSIPFICPTPLRVFVGHTQDVIDISWSKSHFILSASADHNVRLWHVTRGDCLQVFRHPDIATSIDFHPLHDRYFVSGCFDRRLRIWDIISNARTKEWVSLSETVTSVCFSSDGQTVVGGLMNGQVYFYNYEGLKYLTQMNCRNRRGKFKRGSKVTGLTFFKSDSEEGDVPHSYPFNALPPLLVTTNDNRLRLFSLGDFSLRMKYKGVKNTQMQIKANFSEDGKHIVCGSENGGIVVWETQPPVAGTTLASLFGEKQDRNCCAEMILNKSTASDLLPEGRSGLDISRLIGQRNKKRLQSALSSLSRKQKPPAQNGVGYSNGEVATTAAVFAPVAAIIHCSRGGIDESSPCSYSVSAKSNLPSDTNDPNPDLSPSPIPGPSSGISGGDANKRRPSVTSWSQSKLPSSSSNFATKGSTEEYKDKRPPTDPSMRDENKDRDADKEEEESKGKMVPLDVELRESSSDNVHGSRSPESDKTDDVQLVTPGDRDRDRDRDRTNYPLPVHDLSSRVIVASDALGFIRVFVRSGLVGEGTKGSTQKNNRML